MKNILIAASWARLQNEQTGAYAIKIAETPLAAHWGGIYSEVAFLLTFVFGFTIFFVKKIFQKIETFLNIHRS